MCIRRAVDKDADQVLLLLEQVNMLHHLGRPDLFKGPTTKYSREQLLSIFHDDSKPVFVCTDLNDHICGYAFCVIHDYHGDQLMQDLRTIYIDDLCVDEKDRGKGIGTALYHHVLNEARAMGCHNVTLNVWTCNPGAQKFYEKLGMKPQKIGMETILS